VNDDELLKLAAKAAGIDYWYGKPGTIEWDPLHDDGDALRLAVKLGMTVAIISGKVSLAEPGTVAAQAREQHGDPYAATRRAIARAAAAMAKEAA